VSVSLFNAFCCSIPKFTFSSSFSEMLPSPQASLDQLKKIADLDSGTLKSVLAGMEEGRSDKELATAAVLPPLSSLVAVPVTHGIFPPLADKLSGKDQIQGGVS